MQGQEETGLSKAESPGTRAGGASSSALWTGLWVRTPGREGVWPTLWAWALAAQGTATGRQGPATHQDFTNSTKAAVEPPASSASRPAGSIGALLSSPPEDPSCSNGAAEAEVTRGESTGSASLGPRPRVLFPGDDEHRAGTRGRLVAFTERGRLGTRLGPSASVPLFATRRPRWCPSTYLTCCHNYAEARLQHAVTHVHTHGAPFQLVPRHLQGEGRLSSTAVRRLWP